MVTQQVRIAVVGTRLVEAVIPVGPLINDLLHLVPLADPETDWALSRFFGQLSIGLYDHF